MKPIPTWRDLIPRVRRVMERGEITNYRLAQMAGVRPSTIDSALSGAVDSHWGTVTRILSALGLSLRWVMSEPATKR